MTINSAGVLLESTVHLSLGALKELVGTQLLLLLLARLDVRLHLQISPCFVCPFTRISFARTGRDGRVGTRAVAREVSSVPPLFVIGRGNFPASSPGTITNLARPLPPYNPPARHDRVMIRPSLFRSSWSVRPDVPTPPASTCCSWLKARVPPLCKRAS